MSISFDDQLATLLELYGRPGDPIWNSRVRPQLELALELALKVTPSLDSQCIAKIFLAHPQVVEVALETLPDPQRGYYSPLLNPASFSVDSQAFAQHERFLTPLVMLQLRPLVILLAGKLNLSPVELWPEGFQEKPQEDNQLQRAEERLASYLLSLEPYSELSGFELKETSPEGWLLWPRYPGDLMVFGGAQYFMGKDEGMLCTSCVYSGDEVRAFYAQGERCSLIAPNEPGDAPEAWARNCASTARAMISALNGNSEASARGVIGHWENGQFADGETISGMLSALDYAATPPLTVLKTVPQMVAVLPTGAHLVVGLRWKNSKRGHWFNVRNNGAGTEWFEGQTGTSGSWPPPFLDRAEDEGVVLRAVNAKKTWKFL